MNTPFIKFCGVKSEEDFHIVRKSKAEYLGFVFSESKRKVSEDLVLSWLKKEKGLSQKLVGVFVNEPLEKVVKIANTVALSVVQLHGDEDPTYIKQLKGKLNAMVWKVFHHSNLNTIDSIENYRALIDGILIDCKIGKQYGGTGKSFDWSYIPIYIEVAKSLKVPLIIAGGINENNIDSLLLYKIDGIDVSSGIEDKHKKDASLIKKIESKVRR